MKNEGGEVIYVGKAKDLRKRVTQYWQGKDQKSVAITGEIYDLEYVVTTNEVEALITEAQLIYRYHPRYNIDLKAGNRYAFLKFTEEAYPRLMVARKITKDGKYFGPYPSGAARVAAMRAANNIFRLRTKCKPGSKRGCLRYHLGYCLGVCIGAVGKEDYSRAVKDAERFLRGEYRGLIKKWHEEMNEAAANEEFEKAKLYRDQLLALEKLEHQSVSAPKQYDQDVVNYIVQDGKMTLQVFHFSKGIIHGRKEYTFDPENYQASSPKELLTDFLQQYYAANDVPKEIIVPEVLSEQELLEEYLKKISGRVILVTIPARGIKKKLLEIVQKNLLSKLGQGNSRLYELQQALKLPVLPHVIDCIDISHLSGTNTVASLVQSVNGQPAKSGYRKFIIKSFEGNNDFAAIEEVVTRFGKRIQEDKEKRPDLLVIDGGRGQLNSALKAMQAIGLEGIPTIGLAKKMEEIYVPWAPAPIRLSHRSEALQVLQALRDEAHRFVITFQRKKRKIA